MRTMKIKTVPTDLNYIEDKRTIAAIDDVLSPAEVLHVGRIAIAKVLIGSTTLGRKPTSKDNKS